MFMQQENKQLDGPQGLVTQSMLKATLEVRFEFSATQTAKQCL